MLGINEQTKVVARMHPQLNNRGLNIYNPYFEAKDVNAVYLLFKDSSIEKLIAGMRALRLAGAIPAGFENDPKLVTLMDELSPVAKRIGRVSAVVQEGSKLMGYYNGGPGLADAIEAVFPMQGKRVVIMGAGTVAKGLLAHLDEVGRYPSQVAVFNRSAEHASDLAKMFRVHESGGLQDMLEQAQGDVFINTSSVGSPWNKGEDFVFPEAFLKRFSVVADVAFVPLRPPLIEAAEAAGVNVVPGWKMFVHQGALTMQGILKVEIDADVLGDLSRKDFEKNWS